MRNVTAFLLARALAAAGKPWRSARDSVAEFMKQVYQARLAGCEAYAIRLNMGKKKVVKMKHNQYGSFGGNYI